MTPDEQAETDLAKQLRTFLGLTLDFGTPEEKQAARTLLDRLDRQEPLIPATHQAVSE